MQRRRRAGMTGLVLALGLLLAACGESNTPSSYDTIVEKNFLEGCTNQAYNMTDDTLDATDNTLSPDVTGGSDEQCRCQYQVFVDQVPYNSEDTSKPGYEGPTFTELNDALGGDNPGEELNQLPADVREALESCPLPAQSSGTDADADEPTTTTAG
jgi:hypothetical protein